jgi:hypothetical protein
MSQCRATWADFESWPSRHFHVFLFIVRARRDTIIRAVFYQFLYIQLSSNPGFNFHLLGVSSCSLVVAPSLLQFACELCFLFVEVMEEERSLIIDIVGDESEVPPNSSSEDSSGGGSGDDVEAKVEDTVVVDPREST